MKYFFLFIIFYLSSFSIFAQNDTNTFNSNRVYFAYGQSYNLKLDQTYSRLAKHGFIHLFQLGYEKVKNDKLFEVRGGLMIGNLKTKGNNINTIDDMSGSLRIRYLKRVERISSTNLSIYFGANIDFRGDLWFSQNSQLRYGWDINLGSGFSTSIRYKIKPKLSLQYDLDIPLIGVLWRSHNNGQQLITEEIQLEKGTIASAFETPRFSHVFNTLYLDNSLKLYYSLSSKINIYYGFSICYIHIKEPLIKKGYEINNLVGITYKY